jgi:transposase-like protein
MRMSDRGAENVFPRLRWPQTDGKPVCPSCGCQICYDCRRSADQPRWRCKACRADFSVTSGTLFAWHKLPLKSYLMAIAVFCNEVKGKSMLAFSRDLDVQYKTAFVLAHKLREAMASSMKAVRIGGEGRTAEIDGAYFGGHIRPENLAADRIDRRLAENQSGKRQVVVAWILVLNPPRERRVPDSAPQSFRPRRSDAPEQWCCRSSAACPVHHRYPPAPEAKGLRRQTRTSDGIASTRSSICRTPPVGRATALRSGRSKVCRPICADGSWVEARHGRRA